MRGVGDATKLAGTPYPAVDHLVIRPVPTGMKHGRSAPAAAFALERA